MGTGKNLLLIVGGGIAAYKALDLVRRAQERGYSVRSILTSAGAQFITPLSLASLTGAKTYTELFDLTDEAEMGHIRLTREADLVVVAPATADLMAKLANGLANDLASTALLASDKRILFAPAMNWRMWLNPATQRNVAMLQAAGGLFVGPGDGAMACGETGPGRMAEPAEILDAIDAALAMQGETRPLTGLRALVTSGPTHEPIDPVRYVANRSSGKQGHAIAAALAAAGAATTLVTGPVSIADPAGVRTVRVETAAQMLAACEAALPADIAVCAAAVGDWRIDGAANAKLKKSAGAAPVLKLQENPDVLAAIAKPGARRPRLVVGFAAETESLLENAREKRLRKGCDWILANDVGTGTNVMGGDDNTLTLVTGAGMETFPKASKAVQAQRIAARIAAELGRA